MPLEILHLAFMLFRCVPCGECPQVPAAAGFGVFLPRVESILARFEFPDHCFFLNPKDAVPDFLLPASAFVPASRLQWKSRPLNCREIFADG
jgi:hypothetical protein